jgi:hypothetical protein
MSQYRTKLPGLLSIDDFRRFLARAKQIGRHYDILYFFGGEPSLWPDLKVGIAEAKQSGIADSVQVVTNGLRRDISDYGQADRICVSDYGGINRIDQLRLKRQGGRRVRIEHIVHVDNPTEPVPNSLPSECHCFGDTLYNNTVYPCNTTVLSLHKIGTNVEENWVKRFEEWDFTDPMCSICLANTKIRSKLAPPMTLNIFVWESCVGWMMRFPFRGKWIRKIYGWFKHVL